MSADRKKLTILIVDDDPAIRSMFADMATKRGHQVVEANNGSEVLEKVTQSHPDVIVLDVMMPKMDGPQVLQQLKDRNEGVPVIMLSAVGGPFTREHCLELGASDYFVKPFRFAEMFSRIESLGESQR
jgi:DNA-binding response OmpR family regulator